MTQIDILILAIGSGLAVALRDWSWLFVCGAVALATLAL